MTNRPSTRPSPPDHASPGAVRQVSDERPAGAPEAASWHSRAVIGGALVIALAAVAFAGYVRPGRGQAKTAAKTSPAPVKRPLPAGMSEQDVVKWVPLRQSSGRTELAPWTSVDARLVKDPAVLDSLLGPADNPSPASQNEQPQEELRSPDAGEAGSPADSPAKPAPTPTAAEKDASPPPHEGATG